MSQTSPRGFGENNSPRWSQAKINALGEFLGSARWITAQFQNSTRDQYFEPERPVRPGYENFAADDPTPSEDLGPLLGVIAEEVHRFAAAVRAGIMADFAGRAASARKLPPHQRAAALRGLAEARKAALALAKRNAELELIGRRKAAIAARGRRSRNTRGGRKPWSYTPNGPKRP